jgi:hypothetical protein
MRAAEPIEEEEGIHVVINHCYLYADKYLQRRKRFERDL